MLCGNMGSIYHHSLQHWQANFTTHLTWQAYLIRNAGKLADPREICIKAIYANKLSIQNTWIKVVQWVLYYTYVYIMVSRKHDVTLARTTWLLVIERAQRPYHSQVFIPLHTRWILTSAISDTPFLLRFFNQWQSSGGVNECNVAFEPVPPIHV